MTHNEIYTKFMIEYDKANVTSSYPSLTPYEVATILDKAYLALIARKLTGNNTRQVPFEYDTKAVEDLRPLIVSKSFEKGTTSTYPDNEYTFKLNDDLLYYLEGQVEYSSSTDAIDSKPHKTEIVFPLNHRLAQRFKATNSNLPWIKQPISFIENDFIHILIDSYKHKDDSIEEFLATYLKKPESFVKNLIDLGASAGDDTGQEGDNNGDNNQGGTSDDNNTGNGGNTEGGNTGDNGDSTSEPNENKFTVFIKFDDTSNADDKCWISFKMKTSDGNVGSRVCTVYYGLNTSSITINDVAVGQSVMAVAGADNDSTREFEKWNNSATGEYEVSLPSGATLTLIPRFKEKEDETVQ